MSPRASPYEDQSHQAEDRVYASRIDEHLSKASLRHFIGEQGPFFLQGARDETEFFAPAMVAKTRTASNCEAINRLGYYVSFFSSTCTAGLDALTVFTEGAEAALDMVGASGLGAMFQSTAGKHFADACEYLNVKNNAKRTASDTSEQLHAMFGFLGESAESLHEEAVKMAAFAARLYLFSISLVEMTSLVMNVQHWADSVSRDNHSDIVGKWKANPEDFEAFVDAMQACFEQRLSEERAWSGAGAAPRTSYRDAGGQRESPYSWKRGAQTDDEPLVQSARRAPARFRDAAGAYAAHSDEETEPTARRPKDEGYTCSWQKRPLARASPPPPPKRFSWSRDEKEVVRDEEPRTPKRYATARDSDKESDRDTQRKAALRQQRETEPVGKCAKVEAVSACDKTVWPVEEVHEVEAQAQQLAVDADMAELNVREVKTLLQNVPVDIRKECGLPTDTAGYTVLAKNAAKAKKRLLAFVTDMKLAHIQHVLGLLEKPAAKFHLDPVFENGGFARLLAKSETYLINRDEVKAAIDKVDGADNEEKGVCQEELNALEVRMLQEQVADYGTATTLWERVSAFAQKHHRSEPKREDVKTLLESLDSDLREALGISSTSKYEMRIKPREWRNDVQCLFNLSYRVYTAWNASTA